MTYWPWWLSGLALAGVMLFHWFTLHRMMAVSGRISGLIDRLRHGAPDAPPELSNEELLAAIQAATEEEFADESPPAELAEQPAHANAVSLEEASSAPNLPELALAPPPRSNLEHVLFLGGLVLGGISATVLTAGSLNAWHGEFALRSEGFRELNGDSASLSTALLLLGGILVGFGTRMAGGCTSGHGLCGSSRLQPGSLLATLSFFGAGIVTSLALGFFL